MGITPVSTSQPVVTLECTVYSDSETLTLNSGVWPQYIQPGTRINNATPYPGATVVSVDSRTSLTMSQPTTTFAPSPTTTDIVFSTLPAFALSPRGGQVGPVMQAGSSATFYVLSGTNLVAVEASDLPTFYDVVAIAGSTLAITPDGTQAYVSGNQGPIYPVDLRFNEIGAAIATPFGVYFLIAPVGTTTLYALPQTSALLGTIDCVSPPGTGTVLIGGDEGDEEGANWESSTYFTYLLGARPFLAPHLLVATGGEAPVQVARAAASGVEQRVQRKLPSLSDAEQVDWRALMVWSQTVTSSPGPFCAPRLVELTPAERANWREVEAWSRTLDAGFYAGAQPLSLPRLAGLPDAESQNWRAFITWTQNPAPPS